MSTSNLQYLTSEQALADFANFIQQYQIANPELTNVPWITFGGSYSGSLAAWFKLKYPYLVSGSIASSAPLLAKIDFSEYQEVVTKSIGQECSDRTKAAISQTQALLEHPMGWKTLSKMFSLCTDLNATNELNLNNFMASLVDLVDGIVQYNNDNRAFEVIHLERRSTPFNSN
jgi:pimeloyl-ACP methyl ester carboxylesterase